MKKMEKIKDKGAQPDAGMMHLYGQNKKAARRAVDNVRNDIEVNVYIKLEEDVGKNMIYKLAHDRDKDGKDMK